MTAAAVVHAGGAARVSIAAGKDDQGSTVGFASEGAGSVTRRLHRTVVLFVVVMLAGAAVHGFALVNP